MTRIEVQLQGTDAPAGSFATKPKVIYRAGNRYCRVEEQPDIENGIHGLMIISEPDVWMVNLATHSARHMVDRGPTFNCRLPILAGQSANLPEEESKAINGLEFGMEFQFFKTHGAKPIVGPVLQTRQTTAYQVHFGELSVGLFTYGTPERPLAVAWSRGNVQDIYWYSGYGDVDFDGKLFARPADVKIEEIPDIHP